MGHLGFPEPFAVLQPHAVSAAGGGFCVGRPAGLGSPTGEGRAQPPGPNAVLLLPGAWARLLGLELCSERPWLL